MNAGMGLCGLCGANVFTAPANLIVVCSSCYREYGEKDVVAALQKKIGKLEYEKDNISNLLNSAVKQLEKTERKLREIKIAVNNI